MVRVFEPSVHHQSCPAGSLNSGETGQRNRPMNPRVLFIVDNLPRARFFSRFAAACQRQGASFRFLPYRWSSQKYLQRLGYEAKILGRHSRTSVQISGEPFESDCAQSVEVLRGEVTLEKAIRNVPKLATEITRIIEQYCPSHICLWNGSQLIERLVTRLCPDGIEKRFFEIANMPGKIFVDPQGVNAASSLYASPERLLRTEVPHDEEYQSWRTRYLQRQSRRGVPQAKAAQALQWERPWDAVASRMGFGFYPIGIKRMVSRLSGKLRNSAVAKELIDKYRYHDDSQRPYRFFPLQVSGDTQLLLNSDVGNLEALRRVFAECVQEQVDLVIKIHPAENDRDALLQLDQALREYAQRGSVYLSDRPTIDLIHGAEKVYTINSTVGLETLIAGKPLEVLGRAFFGSFVNREDLLKCYLLRYLYPFDYFADEEASDQMLRRVLTGWPCHG